VYAVQTKRGKLNMSSKQDSNVVTAITQLQTALATDVILPAQKLKLKPTRVILCASGAINSSAKKYIFEEVGDPRITFMDSNDLIPLIDKLYPELWYGIDADKFPYLRKLQQNLMELADAIPLSELGVTNEDKAPITDDLYVPLFANRLTSKIRKRSGRVEQVPHFEELPVTGLALHKRRLILLSGEAGGGKTIALRRIGYMLARKAISATSADNIPVYLRCSALIKTPDRLVDIAAAATAQLSNSQTPAFSIDDLVKGYVLLLIDALDEVPAQDNRVNVLQRILDFHNTYPCCRVILTARPYQSILNMPLIQPYAEFKLSPINVRQTRKLITRLTSGRSLPAEATQELMRRLQDVHGIELNPMLVTVFAATSDYRRRDVPANITELFKKFTELMLGRWDQRKGMSQQYQAPLKDFLLKTMALRMHRERVNAYPLEQFNEIIEGELKGLGYEADIDILSEELVYRSGLLRLDSGEVSFRHFIFQEFFAGRAIQDVTFIKTVCMDEWWRKALVFYCNSSAPLADCFNF
jgi:hypothetical protein